MSFASEDAVISAVNWVLWLFQLSMTLFLFNKILNKHASFSALFYTLFVIITIVDSIYFLTVTFAVKWPQFGLFPRFYMNNHWMSHLVKVLSVYFDTVDVLLYAIIAANRYSVMTTRVHQDIWQGRRLLAMLVVAFILPFTIVWPYLDDSMHYVMIEDEDVTICVPATQGSRSKVHAAVCKRGADHVGLILQMGFAGVVVLASLGIDCATAYRYRKESAKFNTVGRRRDVPLLVHSILVSLALIAKIVVQVGATAMHEEQSDLVVLLLLFLSDVRMSLGSVFLFAVSPTVRRGYLRFYHMTKADKTAVSSVHVTHMTQSFRTVAVIQR